jgi:predicted esterase
MAQVNGVKRPPGGAYVEGEGWIWTPTGTHTHTFIYLHGFGCEAREYGQTQDYFFQGRHTPYPGLKVICLEAQKLPITVYGGRRMPAWYDYLTDHQGNAEDDLTPESLAATAKRVHALIRAEAAALGDAKRVLVGGFSQGTGAALHCVATLEGDQVGGFCGIIGHVLACTPVDRLASACAGPIVFNNSRDDDVIQWSWASKTFERLGNGKVPNVSLNLEPGTHLVGAQEAVYLSNFFARSCTPAPADVQLASLLERAEARKRKNGAASRKRRRRNDDDDDDDEEYEDDSNDEEFKKAIRQSLANKIPDPEEQRVKVRQCVEMGFEEAKVRNILAACDWDIEATLDQLMSGMPA